METDHKLKIADARDLAWIEDDSVDLVVTSPPYPMIEMWDELFLRLQPDIGRALEAGDGQAGFQAMHAELDTVWKEMYRVLKKGGILCINIGDATRSLSRNFRLYPNHARVVSACTALGFQMLPAVLWRKQTNAPNKFMGSGTLRRGRMLPSNTSGFSSSESHLPGRSPARRSDKTAGRARISGRSATNGFPMSGISKERAKTCPPRRLWDTPRAAAAQPSPSSSPIA